MINEITATGAREIAIKIETTNRQIDPVTHRAMRTAVKETRQEVIQRTPRGVGKPWPHLARNIEGKVNKSGGEVVGTIKANATQPVGKVRILEEGGVQGKAPPPRNLLPWVMANFQNGDMNAAYILSQRLKTKRRPALRMFANGLKAAEPRIRQLFAESIYNLLKM